MSPVTGYSITETLFATPRSTIYRATRGSDGRPVILKALSAPFPTIDQVARLRREYRVTRAAAADGVVEVLAIERFGAGVGLVLEDCGAESLARLFAGGAMELASLLSIGARLADTLGRVHRRRVIHKDINPSNIVWNPRTDELRLIDFGIATELSRETPEVMSPNVLEGTLSYLSPEATGRMNRAIDYRTDLYSLGVTLYHLLTGHLPFASGDPMEIVHCHIARVPAAPCEIAQGIPAVVSDIVMRLLSKRAEDRYQNAFVLAADLRRCRAALEATGRVPSFEIAEGDVSETFQLPQKLYGRDEDVASLLARFDRIAPVTMGPLFPIRAPNPGLLRSPGDGPPVSGRAEMVLVAGYSGIGKSALVHELHKSIVRTRGLFASGKFDQHSRNVPYASLVQVIQELARQILAQSAEDLALWKARILAAVGPNAALIIDVIREVELILGSQPPVPALPPAEAQNRFKLVFEDFLRAFTRPESPLVVFLDDLQWADLSSLQLIEGLMSDPETAHLMLLGAYRDNEIDASHPLVSVIAEVEKAGTVVTRITLSPLSRDHCAELLADALHRDREAVGALAALCHEKTHGNPFFLGQFLLSLVEMGAVAFDDRARRWTWDMEQITHTQITANVVDLMATKIQKLPADAQRVMRLAACIGNTFDLYTLAVVSAQPPERAAESLWAGLREGLVVPLDDAYKFIEDGARRVAYRFLHDRVQQAAYSLIPEEEQREVHLRVGRLMLAEASAEEREEQIFVITGHCNRGAELLHDRADRDDLAALNLAAGTRAIASCAHVAARGYLATGIALLGEDRWTRRYDLALALHTKHAEASYLSADCEGLDRHASEVIAVARGPLDQVKVFEIKIQACIVQNRLAEAVQVARRILLLVGVAFPDRPTQEDVLEAIADAQAAIAGGLGAELGAAPSGAPIVDQRRIEDLIDLPPMTDPSMLAAARIIAMITSATYVADPALFPLIVLRQISLAARHGNTGAHAFGYGAYGIILAGVLGDFDAAYAFGKLALRVLDRYQAREYAARAAFVWNAFIRRWKEHVRESYRDFQDVYRAGLEVGDLEYAGWGAFYRTADALFIGHDLAELDAAAAAGVQAAAQIKQETARYYTMIVHQTVENLRGLSADPCRLVGAAYDEAAMLPVHTAAGDAFGLSLLFCHKLWLCYLFGRHAEALEHAATAQRFLGAMTSSHFVPSFHFFDALARLALAQPGWAGEERQRTLDVVDAALLKLRVWADHAPMNYAAKRELLEAERARVVGDVEVARASYYRAIGLAREHEYRNDEALATELLAALLERTGEADMGRLMMAKARNLYHLWGAEAKVADLDRLYPDLVNVGARFASSTLSTITGSITGGITGSTPMSTTEDVARTLDLISVIKGSQAISGEVVLTELLEKLMLTVVENAGARWGLLFLEGARPLVAVAKRSSRRDAGSVVLHENAEQSATEYSHSIVRYVQRTREVVVLGDAAADGPFQSDTYVASRRPKSILAMPVLRQQKLVGVLYLENDLVASAFTPDRCKVLELLAAQAAISLENASLYDTLEARVRERTQELTDALTRLRETQTQLVLQEKLASLGNLTAGIAHEIKNPLNFVNNFAELTINLADDLEAEIAAQRDRPDPAGAAAVAELLADIRQNAARIREHGTRADRIVHAMLDHARASSTATRPVDLNGLVHEYVHLAQASRKLYGAADTGPSPIVEAYDEALGTVIVAPEDIGRVVLNLASNALYSLDAKGKAVGAAFTPVLRVSTRGLDDRVEIRVYDNGQGIPAALRHRLFSPFFTTKPPGEGTGLGLSISHDIVVQGHGGTLEFSSEDGEHAEFVVTLPRRLAP